MVPPAVIQPRTAEATAISPPSLATATTLPLPPNFPPKKIISENTFKFLSDNKFIIKHPSPFVIEFDLNINKSFTDGVKLPSIYLLNISTVELEFKNLKLSIHRNKINELKNKFQLLVKKEKYVLKI